MKLLCVDDENNDDRLFLLLGNESAGRLYEIKHNLRKMKAQMVEVKDPERIFLLQKLLQRT